MPLSVSDLLNYYRCPRLLFLNKYGDKTLQRAPTDFLKRLWKVGRDYESRVVDFFKYEKPKYKIGNHEDGFNATLALMKKGVQIIYQGVLKNDEVVGIPDFLIRSDGNSTLGNYYYYAVDIKGASTARERYLFQLATYSYLLGDIQGFTPLYGGLLLLDMDLQIKYFYSLIKQVVDVIQESKNILNNPENMPDLFIDSYCQMCGWYSFCQKEAIEKEDLSLVSGVNRKIKDELQKVSIKSYSTLADCSKDDISTSIILQAKALKEKKIYLKSMPELVQENREIFIDFESDMIFDDKGMELTRVDYLIGLLKNNNGRTEYSYLLLENEDKLLNDFTAFLRDHMDCTFYHYGHYEQSIFDNKWEELPKVNLINMEKVVRDSVIMPVSNYSLKNIARALGFRWKNKDASATQSMCWYSSYLETKDKTFLDLSIEYNKDDCLALLFVKNWLMSLKEKEVPAQEFIDIKFVMPVM